MAMTKTITTSTIVDEDNDGIIDKINDGVVDGEEDIDDGYWIKC